MKMKELSGKSHADLKKLLEKKQSKRTKLQREKYLTESNNVKEMKAIRRDIAQILTVMNNSSETDTKETK